MKNDLNSYHVVLADGSERDIKADTVAISEGGVLSFHRKDSNQELLVAYAPDTWVLCELERRDDTGYPGDSEDDGSGFDREGRPRPEPV